VKTLQLAQHTRLFPCECSRSPPQFLCSSARGRAECFACLRTLAPNLVLYAVTAVGNSSFISSNAIVKALSTSCGVAREEAAKKFVAGAVRACCGVAYDVATNAFFAGAATAVSADTDGALGRSARGPADIATGGVAGRAVGSGASGGSAMPKIRTAGIAERCMRCARSAVRVCVAEGSTSATLTRFPALAPAYTLSRSLMENVGIGWRG
jgi:hypothetical protein